MTTIVKSAIRSGVIRGIIFAGIFAVWVYYSQGQFIWSSFLINFILFTAVHGIFTYFSLKKAQK